MYVISDTEFTVLLLIAVFIGTDLTLLAIQALVRYLSNKGAV